MQALGDALVSQVRRQVSILAAERFDAAGIGSVLPDRRAAAIEAIADAVMGDGEIEAVSFVGVVAQGVAEAILAEARGRHNDPVLDLALVYRHSNGYEAELPPTACAVAARWLNRKGSLRRRGKRHK